MLSFAWMRMHSHALYRRQQFRRRTDYTVHGRTTNALAKQTNWCWTEAQISDQMHQTIIHKNNNSPETFVCCSFIHYTLRRGPSSPHAFNALILVKHAVGAERFGLHSFCANLTHTRHEQKHGTIANAEYITSNRGFPLDEFSKTQREHLLHSILVYDVRWWLFACFFFFFLFLLHVAVNARGVITLQLTLS